MLQSGGGAAFAAAESMLLPAVRLKGLVFGAGEPALALLEVQGGGSYLLRAGDTASVRVGSGVVSLRVKRIHRASVEIEAGSQQAVVVR